jgi:hypothetical protein
MNDSSLTNDILGITGLVMSVTFFIWFGLTLNSINENLFKIADHSERQTKLLASVANESDANETQSEGSE